MADATPAVHCGGCGRCCGVGGRAALGRAQPLDQIGPLPLEMFAVQPISPAVNKIRSKDIAAIEAA
jgi:hypothetical protein